VAVRAVGDLHSRQGNLVLIFRQGHLVFKVNLCLSTHP
jgi:hypothetical protein